MSAERIIGRIARALAEGDVVRGLAEGLSPTDLQSLMLHVHGERSPRRQGGRAAPANIALPTATSPLERRRRPSSGDVGRRPSPL